MGPIIRALFKRKTAAILVMLEIAITLAIVSNALSLIATRSQQMARGSGTDETQVFFFGSVAIDAKSYNASAAFNADRARLLAIDGVENAYATDSLPLSGSGSNTSSQTGPDDDRGIMSATYYADENTLATLGVKLIAGRNFDALEITALAPRASEVPRVVMLSKALAEQLFPGASAIGKVLPGPGGNPNGPEIIGVYDRLQAPWSYSDEIENTTLLPFRPSTSINWVVRVKPGQLDRVQNLAREMLAKADRTRIIGTESRSIAELRRESYAGDRAMIVLMSGLSILLVIITALGIVGMASFWVTQRTKQIGTRRALGATRAAIVREFQVENALLTTAGVALGVALAYGLNYWFAKQASVAVLPALYVLVGIAIVFALGQIAVYRPAQRASQISPAIATRSV